MKRSELKAILKHHKLWIQSDGKQGKRADLRYADFRDTSLQGANLQGANLRYADLWDTSLQGANLQSANLQNANLHGVDLQDANLRDANLQDANLQDANLQDANLVGADLRGADLRGAYLVGAKFTTNFKKVRWFDCATFSEDQIPWVVLHPKHPVWVDTLKWVKAESKQVAGSSEQAIMPVPAREP